MTSKDPLLTPTFNQNYLIGGQIVDQERETAIHSIVGTPDPESEKLEKEKESRKE